MSQYFNDHLIPNLNKDLAKVGAHIEDGVLKTLPNMDADVIGIY